MFEVRYNKYVKPIIFYNMQTLNTQFLISFFVTIMMVVFFPHQSHAQKGQSEVSATPGIFIVKVSEHYHKGQKNRLDNQIMEKQFEKAGVYSMKPVLESAKSDVFLERYYEVRFNPNIPLKAAHSIIKQVPYFEAVLPQVGFETQQYVPNDPFADPDLTNSEGQNQLIGHDFYKAFTVSQGDSNVIIGVVDTGIDFDHEDTQDNLFVDEEGNHLGWDVADEDGDPSHAGSSSHGQEVTGILGATPDNELGMAGTGFNSRYMPIKAARDASPNNISAGYNGIIYAAENNCDIINLSWGTDRQTFIDFFRNQGLSDQDIQDQFNYYQSIINYAVITKNASIFASAGNSSEEDVYFPACLNNVISVTGVRLDSTKQDLSTYNYMVDINALGWFNKTTTTGDGNNNYKNVLGTSTATPVVSGAAALLRAHRPELNAAQVMEQIRVTGATIDTSAYNEPYKEKMGRMLDPYAALTVDTLPSLRATAYRIGDGSNTVVDDGDTLYFDLQFVNYLAEVNSGDIELSAASDNFEMVDSTLNIGITLQTMDTATTDQAFRIYVKPSEQSKDTLYLRIGYELNGIKDYQYLEMMIERSTVTSASIAEKAGREIQLYPNPVADELHIQWSNEHRPHTAVIKDMNGKIVSSQAVNGPSGTTLTNLPRGKGVYALTLIYDDTETHHKIFITQ